MPKSRVSNIDLGTDGAAPPSIPGTGVRGWLRSIYEAIPARLGTLGRKAEGASAPFVLSNEDKAALDATVRAVQVLRDATPHGAELLSNSTFYEDTTVLPPISWVAANATFSYVLAENAIEAANSTGGAATLLSNDVQIGPGYYHFSFGAERTAGTGLPNARIQFRDFNFVPISTVDGVAVLSTTYNRYQVDAVAPAGTVFATVSIRVSATGTTVRIRKASLIRTDGPLASQLPAALRSGRLDAADTYTDGEELTDQPGAGGVLTFTFTTGNMDLVWVRSVGGISRVSCSGATPTATKGDYCGDGENVPIVHRCSVVKVFAPSGATVSVWGKRYS